MAVPKFYMTFGRFITVSALFSFICLSINFLLHTLYMPFNIYLPPIFHLPINLSIYHLSTYLSACLANNGHNVKKKKSHQLDTRSSISSLFVQPVCVGIWVLGEYHRSVCLSLNASSRRVNPFCFSFNSVVELRSLISLWPWFPNLENGCTPTKVAKFPVNVPSDIGTKSQSPC